ncbi:MAG: GIDE domain-containing protein [Candidatus Omnitrophota bacterium]
MERITVYSLFLCGFGVWSFFWGFKRLRRKRLIENIPTSTIRGLALGLVELIGKAKKKALLKSPLTKTECVLYRYTVERYEQRGKSSHWVTVTQGNSFYCPFLIEDTTGQMLVLPQNAELILPVDYEFVTGMFTTAPANLIEFMQQNGISYQGFFGNYKMRFREWYITEYDNVYVLGTANKQNDFMNNHQENLYKRLAELKKDSNFMKAVDQNKDGTINQEEWDAAVSKLEQEVLQKELEENKNNDITDVIISKTGNEKAFIISDQSQKELIWKLRWQAICGVFGGGILALVMLYVFFASMKIF